MFTLVLQHKVADNNLFLTKTDMSLVDGQQILMTSIPRDCEIEQMPAKSYDLILMDVQMPHMDGYKETETIRELSDEGKAHIPIVALTANAFEEDRKMAISKGMNDHIAKPIDVKKVEKVIISVLK